MLFPLSRLSIFDSSIFIVQTNNKSPIQKLHFYLNPFKLKVIYLPYKYHFHSFNKRFPFLHSSVLHDIVDTKKKCIFTDNI